MDIEMDSNLDRRVIQSELSFKGHPSALDDLTSSTANGVDSLETRQQVEEGASSSHPMLVIVMGVSGCGKSTLAQAVAQALHLPFIDGDSLHPQSNIAKMSAGTPLTDEDRKPWLELIRTRAEHVAAQQQHAHNVSNDQRSSVDSNSKSNVQSQKTKTPHGLVVACSALKHRYRTILRGHEPPAPDGSSALPEGVEPPHPDVLPTFFVYIKGDRETLMQRMSERKGHFMKAEMLNSQLATLESPESEDGVVTVRLEDTTEEQVAMAVEGLKACIGVDFDLKS